MSVSDTFRIITMQSEDLEQFKEVFGEGGVGNLCERVSVDITGQISLLPYTVEFFRGGNFFLTPKQEDAQSIATGKFHDSFDTIKSYSSKKLSAYFWNTLNPSLPYYEQLYKNVVQKPFLCRHGENKEFFRLAMASWLYFAGIMKSNFEIVLITATESEDAVLKSNWWDTSHSYAHLQLKIEEFIVALEPCFFYSKQRSTKISWAESMAVTQRFYDLADNWEHQPIEILLTQENVLLSDREKLSSESFLRQIYKDYDLSWPFA